jgi:hypothetical protein
VSISGGINQQEQECTRGGGRTGKMAKGKPQQHTAKEIAAKAKGK